jgi:hypothetical protein
MAASPYVQGFGCWPMRSRLFWLPKSTRQEPIYGDGVSDIRAHWPRWIGEPDRPPGYATKNQRSWFVILTRPRSLRRKTIN